MAPLKRVLCAWCICFPVRVTAFRFEFDAPVSRFFRASYGVRLPLSPFSARRFVRWYFKDAGWFRREP
jgi:hypothetical protein